MAKGQLWKVEATVTLMVWAESSRDAEERARHDLDEEAGNADIYAGPALPNDKDVIAWANALPYGRDGLEEATVDELMRAEYPRDWRPLP